MTYEDAYERPASPYRGIFAEIERLPEYGTADAYAYYRAEVDRLGVEPCVYLSMAITSGGYARDPQLSFGEAMEKNGAYGTMVADAIVRQYTPYVEASDVVVPSDLGKVTGWGQGDYLLFWAHVICGLDTAEAVQLDAAVRASGVLQAPGFHDRTLTREARWRDYEGLIDAYVDYIRQAGLGRGQEGAALPRKRNAPLQISSLQFISARPVYRQAQTPSVPILITYLDNLY